MSDASTPSSVGPLGYGAEPRRYRRLLWRATQATVLTLGVLAIWMWGIPYAEAVWKQSTYVTTQRRWMKYAAPAGFVVFDNDPAEASRLNGTKGYGRVSISFRKDGSSAVPSTGFRSAVFDEVSRGGIFGAEAYLGPRVPPGIGSGGERLVFVDAVLREAADGSNLELLAFQWERATLTPGSGGVTGKFTKIYPYLRPGERLRLLAGQPDPNDAAHFTIPYDLDGQPGTIDGRVKPEGVTELCITAGPLQGR